MGNNASQEDREPLINNDSECVEPLFEELKIVLIGSHNAGKNTVGNAVVGRKVFSFWSRFNRRSIDETYTVSGRRIYLSRVPGWTGELSQSADIKEELVSCIRSSRPHAVLLVINVKSTLTKLTIRTLESNLSSQLWDHTIVVFTNTGRRGCENYITLMPHEHIINKCEGRYVIQSDCDQITEKIEEFVACKNATSFFKLNVPQGHDDIEQLADLNYVVKRIKNRIQSLLTSRETLQVNCGKSRGRKLKRVLIEEQLALKDAEIERLKQIVNDKEREIDRLTSTIHRPLQENIILQENITTLQQENDTLKEMMTTLQKENKALQQKNNALEKMITTLQDENKLQKEEITKLHQRMATLQDENKTLQDENKTLQEEMTKLQKENKRLLKKMITLHEMNKTLQEKIEKVQEENKKLEENIKTLERKIINLQEKIITLQDEITKLYNASVCINVEDKTLHKDITRLRCNSTTLQKENKTLQEEVTSLKVTHKNHSGFTKYLEPLNKKLNKCRKKVTLKTSKEIQLQDISLRGKYEKYKNLCMFMHVDNCSNKHSEFTMISDGEHTWPITLIKILDEMSEDNLKKMKYLMKEWNIHKGLLEGKDKYELADLVRETWGETQSVRKMQEIIKDIPRMDLLDLIEPFLKDHK